MPADQLVRPEEGRRIHERRRLRAAIDPEAIAIPQADAWQLRLLTIREPREGLLALAHDDDVDAELLEHGSGRRRAVRTDRHEHAGDIPNCRHGLLRHAQLGRRAAPEQIGRRRGDHGHLGAEGTKLGAHLIQAQIHEVGVDQQDLMTAGFEQCLGIAVLQRQVRIAAAEIDAAFEGPARVDQRHPHAGTFSISGGISGTICPTLPPRTQRCR